MRAGILAVGTELLMGKIVNTNAAYLGEKLNALGVSVYYNYTVGDNKERIQSHLLSLLKQCDIIVTTGGLGPTLDDITKECIGDLLGLEMILNQESLDDLRDKFKKMNREMPENNIRQAYFPETSIILKNDCGTAPACLIKTTFENHDRHIIVLPGPPREVSHIFDKHIQFYIEELNSDFIYSKYLSVYDIGESALESELMDLFQNQTNPTLATYAGDGRILLRVTSSGNSEEQNQNMVSQMVRRIKSRVGHCIVSEDGEHIDAVILKILLDKKMKLSVGESCTGGGLAATLLKNPGASNVFDSGYITYSNESKIRTLGVKRETIETYGAVSHQSCYEMVKGIMRNSGSDVAIAITGIAGPSGGTMEKPVGRVYIGVGYLGEVFTTENQFYGDRAQIQSRSIIKSLKCLYDHLKM